MMGTFFFRTTGRVTTRRVRRHFFCFRRINQSARAKPKPLCWGQEGRWLAKAKDCDRGIYHNWKGRFLHSRRHPSGLEEEHLLSGVQYIKQSINQTVGQEGGVDQQGRSEKRLGWGLHYTAPHPPGLAKEYTLLRSVFGYINQ